MQLRDYYQDELEYLLDAGKAFSQLHPEAQHLAQRSADPDVERLLEGFAFLSAKIHARLDQGQPQFNQELCEFLMPHQLLPTPSCTMLEFRPRLESCAASTRLPQGTPVQSPPIRGEAVRYQSTRELEVLALELRRAVVNSHNAQRCSLRLDFFATPPALQELAQRGHLDLYIHAPFGLAEDLVFALHQRSEGIRLLSKGSDKAKSLPQAKIELLGFNRACPLLPWKDDSFEGQRLLREYFSFPENFRQLRLHGLDSLPCEQSSFSIEFQLHHCPSGLAMVNAEHFRLHCVPAINLFDACAKPLSITALDRPHRIEVSALAADCVQIYDLRAVVAIDPEDRKRHHLRSCFDFDSSLTQSKRSRFLLERRVSPIDGGLDCYLRLLEPALQRAAAPQRLSIDLRCSHRHLPRELKTGQLGLVSQGLRAQIDATNLNLPSQPGVPTLQKELGWRLHAINALHRRGVSRLAQLRTLCRLMDPHCEQDNPQARLNQTMRNALRSLELRPTTRLLRGMPLSGLEHRLEFDERALSRGQIYLFGRVLHEYFSREAPLNTLQECTLAMHPSGQEIALAGRSAPTTSR